MDIIEALDAVGVDYHEGSDENEITICCPFCIENGESEDSRFRLGINQQTGQAQCFNCGKKSGGGQYIFDELQRVFDTGLLEKAARRTKKKEVPKDVKLPNDFQRLWPKPTDYWGKVAYEYVRSRGVTKRQIRQKKIGYSLDGKYHHRVIFPIYWKKKLQGFVGRDFTLEQSPPYKNSVGSKTLYSISSSPSDTICLVEGVFDALSVARAQKRIHAGATLGHTLTERQLKQLRKYKVVVLWYDPDEAGVEGLIHDYQAIKSNLRKVLVRAVIPRTYYGKDDSDPSELSSGILRKRIRKAVTFTDGWVAKLKSWRAFDE